MIDETSTPIYRVKTAFLNSIYATIGSIVLGFGFKIWLAQWVPKTNLALYHSTVDVVTLSLILLTGFRSSMVVSYSQSKNDRDITNIFRLCLISAVLIVWGVVLPYFRHKHGVSIEYSYMVSIILGMGLKIYFTNQTAMYRLYSISNKVTWLEPFIQTSTFFILYFGLKFVPLASLFYSLALSYFGVALFMFFSRRSNISTLPITKIHLDHHMVKFIKKSFTSSLESGSSILMVYLLVFLIIRYFSIDDLGDFQVVVRPIFMYLTLLFVFPIYRFALPEISVCMKNRDYHQIKLIKTWIIKLSCAVSGTFAILMIICGKRIVMFIFPNQYESAVPLLLSFSLFYIFIMLNAYQLSFIKAVGSFTQSLVIRLTGIISLILSFFILRSIDDSIIIVIYAWGIGVIVMFIISSFAVHRIMSDLEI